MTYTRGFTVFILQSQYHCCWWPDDLRIQGFCNYGIELVWNSPASISWGFNSSPPSAAYMRQWSGSAFFQIMAYHLFGTRPLPKPKWGRDKMAAISQTFSNTFSSMELLEFFIKLSLKVVPKSPINNIPALVQIMACHLAGAKPLSEPMMVSLLTKMCVTWHQWVKY